MDLLDPVEDQYRRFVPFATGYSPCFEEWALGVVDDPEVQAWIAGLPQLKQQPNLVFAAARWHGVPAPGPYAGLRDALLGDDGPIRATILSRSTQTNEVGRLATLAPVFAMLAERSGGGPLALLEAGASAGLCLFPDRWGYAWSTSDGVVALGPDQPRLHCEVDGPLPLPDRLPEIGWRGGVDLNPLDITDADHTAWLTNLVWPEHADRHAQLQQAFDVARADPPGIVPGDLLAELPRLVDQASRHGRVVVFHSAVIAYLDDAGRSRFHRMMADLVAAGACHWVSNEADSVLPAVTATGPVPPAELARLVLGVDGEMVAWTDGHGRAITWLSGPADRGGGR